MVWAGGGLATAVQLVHIVDASHPAWQSAVSSVPASRSQVGVVCVSLQPAGHSAVSFVLASRSQSGMIAGMLVQPSGHSSVPSVPASRSQVGWVERAHDGKVSSSSSATVAFRRRCWWAHWQPLHAQPDAWTASQVAGE